MIKVSKTHTVYEIYCEHAAESVYMLRKPTKTELDELRKVNWPAGDYQGKPVKLLVDKLPHVFVGQAKCRDCDGLGQQDGDRLGWIHCYTCRGTGKVWK